MKYDGEICQISAHAKKQQAPLYESVTLFDRSEKQAQVVLIAFGANLPFQGVAPEVTVRRAVSALAEEGFVLVKASRLYRTPCHPRGAGPDYVNAAAAVTTIGRESPAAILTRLHRVESRFGRRRAQRWGMRTLDIDLIAVGEEILPDRAEQARWQTLPAADQARLQPDELILPHPRLQDRAFVLVPLAEVAPDWRHPVLGKTVQEMRDGLSAEETAEILPLEA